MISVCLSSLSIDRRVLKLLADIGRQCVAILECWLTPGSLCFRTGSSMLFTVYVSVSR